MKLTVEVEIKEKALFFHELAATATMESGEEIRVLSVLPSRSLVVETPDGKQYFFGVREIVESVMEYREASQEVQYNPIKG